MVSVALDEGRLLPFFDAIALTSPLGLRPIGAGVAPIGAQVSASPGNLLRFPGEDSSRSRNPASARKRFLVHLGTIY